MASLSLAQAYRSNTPPTKYRLFWRRDNPTGAVLLNRPSNTAAGAAGAGSCSSGEGASCAVVVVVVGGGVVREKGSKCDSGMVLLLLFVPAAATAAAAFDMPFMAPCALLLPEEGASTPHLLHHALSTW